MDVSELSTRARFWLIANAEGNSAEFITRGRQSGPAVSLENGVVRTFCLLVVLVER